MSARTVSTVRRLAWGSALALVLAAGAAQAQTAPIIQPGAPGQPPRVLSPEEAARLSDNRFSDDDVRFMQDMILHHAQALDMARLVRGRTNHPDIVEIAGRIDSSQEDEIAFMRGWLSERGRSAPETGTGHDAHGGHHGHGAGANPHAGMPGMASPEQMAALAAASGAEFDRQFLTLMIAHHAGAVTMVEQLLARPGSAYDPELFRFVNDISNEQQGEIRRMERLLAELSPDPRTGLSAGFRDAGQAIWNLSLAASLPKPEGFYDPSNPSGRPLPLPDDGDGDGPRDGAAEARFSQRGPFLSFAFTDMAFQGDLLAVGSYHGFNLYRLGEDAAPQLISSVVCPGGQGDVSLVGNLLLMSVESTSGRVDCGRQGVGPGPSPERFRGLRIFDITDPARPVQVGQVQTCRGSHTHSVVSADERRIIVYNSGTASVRDERELAGCVVGQPGETRTALFRIDVIEIPLADPASARIVDSPAVFAGEDTIAGLWGGGDHGEGTQTTSRTDHCHDITVFPSRNLAAGACSGNGVIFDISDPLRPRRIHEVTDPGFAYWHSATFDNEGETVLFTDEWGGGGRPRCRVQDPRHWGANAFYDIVDGRLERRGVYKLPAAQSERENCVAHNGSIIPVPGRDLFVQAWYQGGISVIDFTDPSHPYEIAYFDRGPMSDEVSAFGGFWSAYWYGGRIYGTEISRGLDVLELLPSEHLTEAEIAAARLADQGERFNPQQQYPVTWPDHPTVARAYVDQLARAGALAADRAAALTAALVRAEAAFAADARDPDLARELEAFAADLAVRGDDRATARRAEVLTRTLTAVAERLS